MEDQINEVQKAVGEEIPEDIASPAAGRQLVIYENAEKLLKEKSEKSHSVNEKLIYIMKKV